MGKKQDVAGYTRQALIDEGWDELAIDAVFATIPVSEAMSACTFAGKVRMLLGSQEVARATLTAILVEANTNENRIERIHALGLPADRFHAATLDYRLRGAIAALGGNGNQRSRMPAPPPRGVSSTQYSRYPRR